MATQPTVRNLIRKPWTILVASFLLVGPSTASPETSSVRVDVVKRPVMVGDPPVLLFPQIRSDSLSRAGFSLLADYGSHTLYEGPPDAASSLAQALDREGYDARIAVDLDEVRFQDFSIDPDTGATTPSLASTTVPESMDPDGLFILVLKGYPVESWLNYLASANIRILQELPPAAYLVRGNRALLADLKSSRSFVRGVFPLLPGMKKVLFGPSRSESPFRQVSIEAADEKPSDSLSAHLGSISDTTVASRRSGRRVRYSAAITDLDADVLTYFENVYSIAAVGEVGLSSERQGVILFQQGTPLTLPDQSPNYAALLVAGGVYDFGNTRIGVLDTGFNDGSTVHPDFPNQTIEPPIDRGLGTNSADQDLHGTLVTSILAGFVSAGQRVDAQGYRFTLGLAPTARVVLYKNLACRFESSFTSALNSVVSRNVNIVNLSFNTDLEIGCNYGSKAREVDERTRNDNLLFTIAAGNAHTMESGSCQYVRDPGTAKNAITAGATMNYVPLSLGWPDLAPPVPSCDPGANNCLTHNWSRLNAGVPNVSSDARNIPSFSARKNPSALVKPDLVAPATHITGPVGVLPPPPPGEPTDPDHRCGVLSIFCNESVADYPGTVRYGYSAGTSFAAPAIAGAAAVIRKWYLNANGQDPSPAMTKAVLVNGARDIGGSLSGGYVLAPDTLAPIGERIGNIPNEYQGWGMLSLARLLDPSRLDTRRNFYFFDQRAPLVPASNVWQKYLYVVDGYRDTRVTLVWTDPPSDTNSQQKYIAINNLNLSATASGGSQRWYGNLLSEGYSVLNPPFPIPDHRNNVEQIIIPSGTFGTGASFLIAVDPFTIMSENQDFALFVDNATEPATALHTVSLCRVVDTRNPVGPYGGPALGANATRTFPIANQCGIPVTARAVALNVTVVQSTAMGSLSLYPGGISTPTAETLYYAAGQIRANNGIIAVAPGGDLAVRANQASGTAHVLIDVSGYFQ